MAMSNITVAGITPTLSILGPTQQFIFDQNLSSFQLVNVFVPTALIPSQTNSEFRNNALSGFRWIHTTALGDTIGEFKLQSFVNASPTGTDIFGINDSNDIIFYSPISFPGFIVTADINMDSYKIINLADPTDLQDAATKSYVDSIAAGFVFKESCYAASTANLTATYSNGAAGVGATLTNTGALIPFAIDGVTPPINSRILIKDQTSQFQNGVYSLTVVGDGVTAWVLTRATDYDTSAEILTGTLFVIKNGTVNDDTIWLQTDIVTTVGTDPISFNQFAYGPSTFLQVNNNLDDLDNATTARLNLGLTDIAIQTVIDHCVLVGNAGNTITSLTVPAIANQVLLSGGIATDPSWSIATYPANTTANQLLYSSGTNTITGLPTSNNGVLVTNGSGVPSVSSTLPTAVQDNITSTGIITTGTWEGTTIDVDSGGTGFETTIPYGVICGGTTSTADLQNAGIGGAGQVLTSTGTSSLPIWMTPGGGGIADATYIIQTADLGLANAQVLASLDTGLLKNTTATGVLSTAVAGVDYYAPGFPTTIIDTSGGLNNLFLGTLAGNLTMTGSYNTAVAYQALRNNTTGSGNDAFGYQALFNNTTGAGHSAFGTNSLGNNTAGTNSSSFGYQSLFSNTIGDRNGAFGYQSLFNNTTGLNNASFGYQSLFSNTTGSTNNAFGNVSLFSNTTGTNNSAFGDSSLSGNITGSFNSAYGSEAGVSQSIYNSCTLLGYNADASVNNLTNAIAIGANAAVSTNNTCVIGTTGITLNVGGDGLGNIQGTWNGADITVPFGGTGLSTTTAYGVICGGTTSAGNLQNAGTGTTGQVLTSTGASSLPVWSSSGGGGAPSNATYIIQTADAGLPSAQVLSVLTTGLLKNTTATGVLSTAVAGVDYYAPGYPTTIIDSSGTFDNLFVGTGAGNLVTPGLSNTGFGRQVLSNITTTGNDNCAFGEFALKNTTTGYINSAFGNDALLTNTTGYGNSAFGIFTLRNNTTGIHNSAFGNSSLQSNTTGNENSAFGLLSLNSNTIGISNSAFGASSLTNNTIGIQNSAFGALALFTNTTGSNNVAVGDIAGTSKLNSNNCVFLGYNADASVNNLTNAIALGANASVSTDNTCSLGSTGTSLIVGGGTGVITAGSMTIINDPILASDATNKGYVDAIASGFDFKNPCFAATTANLTATYNNGLSGIGAKLTNNGTLAAFSVDGQSPAINSRILVKNQASTAHNGVYYLTTVGSVSVAWVLTRSTDYDQSSEINEGNLVPVENGTINAQTIWLQTTAVTTVGTNPISFTQFSYGPSTFLQVGNNLSDLSNAATARGNLGLTNIATQTLTQYSVLLGDVSNAITSLSVPSVANQILLSGAFTNPSWSTNTVTLGGNFTISGSNDLTLTTVGTTNVILPTTGVLVNNSVATLSSLSSIGTVTTGTWNGTTVGVIYGGTGLTSTTANQLLYSSGADIIAGLPTSNDGVLVTNGSGVPSISSALPSTVQGNITSTGIISTGIWNGTNIGLSYGGTNASLTASNGGIIYSTASAMAVLSGTATAGQILQSGSSSAPSWSTAIYPTTTTANQLLYSSTANIITGLTTFNNGVLITNGSGVPSISSTLPSAVQDNITSTGTITTGVWNGSIISPTYGGTGVNNGIKTITLDGNLVTSGANSLTLTTTAATNITLPTTGTLVNSTVTTLSSLVSVGTITTGVWNGTPVTVPFGGTGLSTTTAYGVICGGTTSTGNFQNAGTGTTGQVLTSNGSGTLPTWQASVSSTSSYGGMYMQSNASASNSTIFIKVTGTTITGSNLNNFIHTNGRLTYTGSSTIAVHAIGSVWSSYATSGNSHSYTFAKNGTVITESTMQGSPQGSSGTKVCIPFSVITQLSTNNYLEVYMKNSAANNMTPVDMIVTIVQV